MSHAHGALFILAALVFTCAQGCRTSLGASQAATLPHGPAHTSAGPQTPVAGDSTPTPYVPPFPAQKRGDEAFETFVLLSDGRRFESREVGRKSPRKDLKVGADYPVLVGDRSPAAREFNRRARSFVVEDVTPYLDAGRDLEKEKDPFWKDVEEFHNVFHKVVFASDDVVSVLFYVEGYNWGAGHGYHHPVTLNFDLKAGREIRLAQLFKPGSGYLQTIAKLCDEELKRQFPDRYPGGYSIVTADGVKPKPDNYKSWVVTRDGLVFIFEEYQVVAYADGEPKVLIPFDRLKEIIEPQGVLARLAAHR